MATLNANTPQQQSDLPPSAAEAIRVLIIDDHLLVRNGLRILLESQDGITVVGEASNAAEAMATISSERPDIILLDLDVANDLDWLPELYKITPEARVIVLAGTRDSETHCRAVRLGAIGLVRKEQASEVLLQAITKVHAGEVWLEPTLVADVLGQMTRGGLSNQPTPKLSRSPPSPRASVRSSPWLGRGLKTGRLPAIYVSPKPPYGTI
jgi:DNA-binding NarL/FixJ family response regulator